MPFVDICVKERKGGSIAKFKVKAKGTDSLKKVITEAINKYLRRADSEELPSVAFGRIKSVQCKDYNFEDDDLEEPEATITALNSDNTPIESAGFSIELNPKETASKPNKKQRCSREILLKKVAVDLQYFEAEEEAEGEGLLGIDMQILGKLYKIYRDKELGWADADQKTQLQNNTYIIKNVLCYIEKTWNGLFHKPFPTIPKSNQKFETSLILKALATTQRNKPKP